MIISLEKISKIYNGVNVLNNVALTVEEGDRIGLVGINGCGKSTLLRIITGLEAPENLSAPNEPKIHKTKDKTIGFLAQNTGLDNNNLLYEEMRSVFKKLDETAARLREIEAGMTADNSEEYSRLTAYFEANDGYLTDVKINKVLNGMGFPPETYKRVISTLSGGEKTRLALAKLLLENPALLVLDEPTNHLDFNTIIWLEDYLKEYKGALLIVSHDRYFLDKLCTSVCEIERGTLRRFKGNYSAFTKIKAEFVERQLKEYEAQRQEIAKLEDYVARNIVRASTSNMAKSRVKKLESMEIIEKPVLYEKTAKVKFSYSVTPPLDILRVKNIDVKAGEKPLIDSLTFNIRRGEKLGIMGANGTGKSTLLKIIQKLSPVTKGTVEWAEHVKISYFEQSNARLDMNDTVINAVHKNFRMMKEVEIRNILGSVRLTGENVFKKVGVISGGERAKLCFALMMLERGNVLILDEPTNHLDIATREVIEDALCEFDGTIIFVSHDRYLLNKLSTRILEISENNASFYESFDECINARRVVSVLPQKLEKPEKNSSHRSKSKRAEDAKHRARLRELETEIETLEASISQLETELADPEICADYILVEEKCRELEAAKERLNEVSDEWLIFQT